MRIAVYALEKRVSALTACTLASAIWRAAPSSKRRMVSFWGVICSRLMLSRFCKLIFVTDQEYFWLQQEIHRERILFRELGLPLTDLKDLWIDLPRQLLLRRI